MTMRVRLWGRGVLALMLSVWISPAPAAFDDQRRFTTMGEFRVYAVEQFSKQYRDGNAHPSLSTLSIESLYSLNDELSVVRVKDTSIKFDVNAGQLAWPVLVLWKSKRDVFIRQISEDTLFEYHEAFVRKVNGIEPISRDGEKRRRFSIVAGEALRQSEGEGSGFNCREADNMYLVELDSGDGSIDLLTEMPVPLATTKSCGARPEKALSLAVNGDTLKISAIGQVAPEQQSWVGMYRTRAGKLERAEAEAVLVKQIQSADKQALEAWKQRRRDDAIAIMKPLIDLCPVDFLNAQTVAAFNNYAFFLLESGRSEQAIPVLRRILTNFPSRTVTHLNIADAYYEQGAPQAGEHYKTYIRRMEAENKKARIPKHVWERVAE